VNIQTIDTISIITMRCNQIPFFRFLFTTSLFAVLFFPPALLAQQGAFPKVLEDIETKYTSVGNIGLTVTNFGTIGTRNNYWPKQPSCEYPQGSRIEHIYQGGLWIGANLHTQEPTDPRNGLFLVSTGANDRSSASRSSGEGYEFNTVASDSITELSILTDDRPSTSQFNPLAVSHQDFICDYTDRYTHVPSTGDSILNHVPLGIRVHQESYAWNFSFSDFFVILRYQIFNESAVDTLDSVYVGFWDNAVVRNTNYVRPGATGYFNNTGHGFDSTERMAYSFDYNGAPGGPPADSYIGLKLLGSYPFPSGVDSVGDLHYRTYYNAWQYRLSSGDDALLSPTDDYNTNQYLSRYSRMTQSMPNDRIAALRVSPKNVTYLLSTGPYHQLLPGDSLEVVFAVVCAKKYGKLSASLDTKDQRKTLYANANWAQRSYLGEDANGNNILDLGEDIARRDSVSSTEYGLRYEPDGKITRYLLPTPPRRPKFHVEVENKSVTLYWNKWTSEESIDPISGRKNFEGYRIYRSNAGEDISRTQDILLNLSLVGDFDRPDDNIGFNTGFSRILLSSPKMFSGDTVQYWYRFPPTDEKVTQLNGWQYIYAISAYSSGDSANGVSSLESSFGYFRAIPSTPANDKDSGAVGVYPNPYYAKALWDGSGERMRKIYFYNLPSVCEIVIYTLAGDIVTVINHDATTYHGDDINWFSTYGDRNTKIQFAGGEHAWDLITRNDQAIATGLYLFTVRDIATGDVKRGKFLIVK
jgi:hypothetical protein